MRAQIHTFTHTVYIQCVPHGLQFLSFLGFLRRQQCGVLKIDLVSEAESVCTLCFLFFWSRPLSFILLKTYTLLYGFRDTMSDLHRAEHKWVKRKYNIEQSPLLTPPGAYRHLQSAPALFMPLSVLSTSQTCFQVRSNGVGSSSTIQDEKNEKQVLIWKCLVLLFLKAFICIFSLSWWTASGHGWGVYRMFCDQCFLPLCVRICVCACALMYVSNLVSCRIYMSRQESHISDKVQPIKYNSWLLQCPWIVVITLVLVCV